MVRDTQSRFDISKIEKLCHEIQAIDRYLSRIPTPGGMPDIKKDAMKSLRDELKKITDEDLEMMGDDAKKVRMRARRILGMS